MYQLPYISQNIQILGIQFNLICICWAPITYKGTVVDIQGNTKNKLPDRRTCIQNTIKDGKYWGKTFKMLGYRVLRRVTEYSDGRKKQRLRQPPVICLLQSSAFHMNEWMNQWCVLSGKLSDPYGFWPMEMRRGGHSRQRSKYRQWQSSKKIHSDVGQPMVLYDLKRKRLT